jgi:hypothetical protein
MDMVVPESAYRTFDECERKIYWKMWSSPEINSYEGLEELEREMYWKLWLEKSITKEPDN